MPSSFSQPVSSTDSRTSFKSGMVSDMHNLEDVFLCHDIATKTVSSVIDFAKKQASRLGFHAWAHVVIFEDFVEVLDPLDEMIVPILILMTKIMLLIKSCIQVSVKEVEGAICMYVCVCVCVCVCGGEYILRFKS
jgi:hypothetical protein